MAIMSFLFCNFKACKTTEEEALLYGEGLTPESSTKRLSKWVQVNPSLTDELERCGWKKGKKILTPIQVQVIVRFLGEP